MNRSIPTKEQQHAILRLYHRARANKDIGTYRQFRRRFYYSGLMGCFMGEVWGMTVGIESDGYTHS